MRIFKKNKTSRNHSKFEKTMSEDECTLYHRVMILGALNF
jgi:hypothetical protein